MISDIINKPPPTLPTDEDGPGDGRRWHDIMAIDLPARFVLQTTLAGINVFMKRNARGAECYGINWLMNAMRSFRLIQRRLRLYNHYATIRQNGDPDLYFICTLAHGEYKTIVQPSNYDGRDSIEVLLWADDSKPTKYHGEPHHETEIATLLRQRKPVRRRVIAREADLQHAKRIRSLSAKPKTMPDAPIAVVQPSLIQQRFRKLRERAGLPPIDPAVAAQVSAELTAYRERSSAPSGHG
jgi:hypothetical protein